MTDKTQKFLQKLKESGHWNDDYDYSKVEYVNSKTKVIVIDKKIGTEHLLHPKYMLDGQGCSCNSRNIKNGYLTFDEAKKFVCNLKLKSQKEWNEYCKTGRLRHDIPKSPQNIYKNEWKSLGEWLGTDSVASQCKKYLSFTEARDFVRSLDLKGQKEWHDWWFKNRPNDIPYKPERTYKEEWKSTKDWLGYKLNNFIPFDEAKSFVMNLNLNNLIAWKEYRKNNNIKDIPSNPQDFYDEWVNWGDFLGTKNYSGKGKAFVTYDEAKCILIKYNLKSEREYRVFTKTEEFRKLNIPVGAGQYYTDFISYADFLGYLGNGSHQWSKQYIIDFIKSLQSELTNLDSVELITIINSNNLAKKLKTLGRLEDLVSSTAGTQERQNIVNNIINDIESQEESDEEETEDASGVESEFDETLTEGDIDVAKDEEVELEALTPTQELHMYDNNMVTASLDDENIDFLMKNQLKKLWNKVLNKTVDVSNFRKETGGERFTIIKNWFFEEYEEVTKIKSPTDYIFQYQPNLMQKLVTYRLTKELRYGNWSGTGAGKTLSAIFAGRYAGAKNTLIICNNATVEGWVNSIHEYFSNNKVYTKRTLDHTDPNNYTVVDKYNVNLNNSDNSYFVLNYETFQQEDGEYVVSELLKNNTIDYIILDEVQNVKQRDDDKQSTRRDVVNKLVIHASEKNDKLMVMGMSATPVINNLTEPKKLIELLTGEAHNELETRENIINGIEMYKALTRHGLRYKPDYGISVNEEIIEVDGSHLSEKIIKIPRGAVVDFERVLIESKLDAIADKIKKGTLIYTHYVTEFSYLIGDYIKNFGFTVGYYTGQDKSGLRQFKEGKVDVLIGSAPVGTGVDGIQYVCNTLIPIVLPWTSSEYDQLVGRVNRQGSNFDYVNIYIPQVIIKLDNGIWSWDKRRHNIIKFKATLADLAVDGRVPKNLLPSKSKLVEDAKKELADWVKRLNGGDIITFEREELMIPLNPKQIERNINRLGDFSGMNKKWSTTRSNNTHDRLSKDPSEWYYYHTLYSEKRKTWSEIPYVEIAKKIKSRPDWIVGDFGCGENLLSKEIKNKVHAFDHVAVDDYVIACDIMNVPIEDGVLDVAVFSLSLMGSNHKDYFKEAYRTLKTYGNIFICEPASKWEGREDELKQQLESVGFKCFGAVNNTDKFIYIDGIKY